MSYPANTLQNVATFQKSGLGYMINMFCGIATANKKFENFQDFIGNLGDTVNFSRPPRFIANDGLIIQWQPAVQLVQSLTVDKSKSVGYSVTSQEYIFNAEKYVDDFNSAAVSELASAIESDQWGVVETNTYRIFGDFTITGGVSKMDEISSFQQLAQSISNFEDFGCPKNGKLKYYIPSVKQATIAGSGLQQFALDRNNELAATWEVGDFGNAMFYQSNLLRIHTSGTIGNTGADIEIVSIDATGTLLSITTTPSGTFKAGDILRFKPAVVNSDVKFLTYIGHKPCSQGATVRVTADATALVGTGAVTLSIYPALISDLTSANANIDTPIVATQVMQAFPNHRMGLIVGGDARYLAMPRLPEQSPYITVNDSDPDSGLSFRIVYGSVFGGNQMGMALTALYGFTMVDDYAQRVAFPVS